MAKKGIFPHTCPGRAPTTVTSSAVAVALALAAVAVPVVGLVGVPGAGAATTTTTPPTTTTTTTPAEAKAANRLLSRAIAAAKAQKGVSYVSDVVEGTDSDRTTVRAGQAEGSSTVVLREGKLSGHLSLVSTSTMAYVRGDQHGLQSVDFSATAAGKQKNRWLSVSASVKSQLLHSLFEQLGETITVPTVVGGISLASPVQAGKSTVDGQAVLRLDGTSEANPGPPPTNETLYVTAKGSHLPVEAVIGGSSTTGGSSASLTVVFKDWGPQPAPQVPKGARAVKASWLLKSS